MSWKNLISTAQRKITNILGVQCYYLPLTLNVSFIAVFSNDFEIYDKENGVKTITTSPNIFVKLSDLPNIPKRDESILVDGKSFLVKEYHPDGEGGAILELYE